MYEYKVEKVLKVLDGDTVDLLVDLGFSSFKKDRFRLDIIDTPEINSKDMVERKFAEEAKAFLTEWLNNQSTITVKTIKDDKYGRMLAKLYGTNGECINDILLESGYAWIYPARDKNFDLLLEKRKLKV